jgi:hypothetical protein
MQASRPGIRPTAGWIRAGQRLGASGAHLVRSASQPARQFLKEPQPIVPTAQARWNVLQSAIGAGGQGHLVAARRKEPIEHQPQNHQEEVHEPPARDNRNSQVRRTTAIGNVAPGNLAVTPNGLDGEINKQQSAAARHHGQPPLSGTIAMNVLFFRRQPRWPRRVRTVS